MSIEWQAPAVVLDLRPHGEGGAVVTVLTEAHGRHAGLVKGGGSRAQAGLWLPGNLIEARWVARLSDQLGSLSGELVHPAAALAMDEPLALALLSSACTIAADALPEREAHPRAFAGLVSLIGHLAGGAEGVIADYVRFEALILTELGYGLDLATCAVTGVAWSWTGSLTTGQALVVDAGARTVRQAGVDAYSGFALASTHTARGWLPLAAGINSLQIASVGPGSAALTFYPQFL
jgi:DNA repair protein RecO (recombination protein O)